ncbi:MULTISPECIES: DUF2207 domain-containing protein [unclassified Bacillus (in: firmicutes)]|uniref:DUF2207 domain-containing protein n=1 Tax=unclassified Bacillus (in: firmicutes) TaxID=185979 RepID=UPI000BFA4184|nr:MULTISPECIES: DUF2207 domain-containing protein [unclassified Bacillus (in: firmicutes)]PEU19742.1 DUF2207 domain-containing protein [Bacillus sp. AFS014408]PFW64878.1 DUF2207 domain-containing protein [Bacillus sp. AFS075034]
MASSRIKGITVEIGGDTVGLQNALKDVNKRSNDLARELKDVERLLKFNPGNVEALAQKQELLTQRIEATTEKLDKLKEAEQQVQAQFERGDIGEEQYRAFRREIEYTEGSLRGLKNNLANMKAEQESVANSTRQLETLFQATGTNVNHFADALGNHLTNAIRQGTATSRQLEQALELIGREALGAETDIERLQRILRSVDDGNSIENVRDELRELSREAERAEDSIKKLDIGLENVIGGLAAGGGISAAIEQALDMSKLKTKIDITFDVPESSKRSVEEAVRGISAYGLDAEEALEGVRRQWALNKNISDESNAAIVKGAAAIAQAYEGIDFTELIQETNEIAHELGITNDSALGLTAALLKVGFPPEQLDIIAEYGGQLTRAGYQAEEVQAIMEAGVETGTWNIDNLLDGLKEGRIKADEFGQGVDKAMKEALEGTNISAEQLEKWGQSVAKGGREGSAAMTEIAKALVQIEDETKRNEIGVKLFGTMYEDQGQNITNTLIGAQEKVIDFDKNQQNLNESIKKMDANPAVKFQKAMEDLKMALEPVLSVIADLISKFAEWISNNPQLAATLTAVAVAIGVIAGAIMALAPIVVTISTISWAMAGWIALFAIIIAAVVALGVVIYQNWESIKNWTIDTYNFIKDYLSELWSGIVETASSWLSSLVETVSGWWSSLVETTTGWLSSLVETASSWWSSLVETASSWLSSLVETVSGWWSSIVETSAQFFGQLKQFWEETWNSILAFLDPIISLISTVLQAGWLLIQAGTQIAWAAICKYIIDPITEAYNWVSGKIGELVTWLSGKYEEIKSATLAAWSLFKQYIVQPVQEAWSWVKEKLGDLANWILGKWENIKSATLAAWNLVKQYVIEPIVSAYNSVKEKVTEMYNTANEKFNAIKNAASEKFNAAKEAIVGPIRDAVDTVKGWIDKLKGFFEGLKLKIPKPEMPPLPHFSLQTSTKSILGKDITFPSGINVDWRAKGGIFTQPTIFGMNNGKLQGAGEAGPEAVLPLNKKTLGDIGKGIAATMQLESPNTQLVDVVGTMNQLASDMSRMMANSMNQLSGLKSVMSGVYNNMSSGRQAMTSNITNPTFNYPTFNPGVTGSFPMQGGDLIIEVPVVLEGRDVARGTYRYTSEYQRREETRNSAF